jgi:hypothetical protein
VRSFQANAGGLNMLSTQVLLAQPTPNNDESMGTPRNIESVLADRIKHASHKHRAGQLDHRHIDFTALTRLAIILRSSVEDHRACVVLGWVVDLVQNGTRSKSDAAASTVVRYVSSLLKSLWHELQKFNEHWADAESRCYADLYQRVLATTPSSSAAVTRTALMHWHGYLMEYFGAPALAQVLLPEPAAPAVNAQAVWLHEQQRAFDLLEYATGDERLLKGTRVLITK